MKVWQIHPKNDVVVFKLNNNRDGWRSGILLHDGQGSAQAIGMVCPGHCFAEKPGISDKRDLG